LRALLSAVLGLGLAASLPAQFVLFPVSDTPTEPGGVSSGPDGNIWFTVGNQVGRITASGSVTKFDLPTANAGPGDMVAGPDGNLWFLEGTARQVGRISPAGVLTTFQIPGAQSPQWITVGPDAAIWLSDFLRGSIYRVSLSGDFTEFPIPSGSPQGLAGGSDGNLWFINFSDRPNQIGRMTPSGALTSFSRPSGSFGWSCAHGPDGNVWYTVGARIFGRVTPSGTITEFPFIGDRGHMATSITVGPDGNLWMPVDESFVCIEPCTPLQDRDAVLRVSPGGAQTRYELTEDLQISDSSKITAGQDGSLWFTARRGLVRFFPGALVQPTSVPMIGGFARVALLTLLALAGFLALRR